MARARNELNEVFRVSTIGEALAELGTDPQKYESLYQLRQQRPTEYTEKVLPSLSPLERNALGLLQAGYSTGAEPEEFLSRLGAYMDYEVDLNAPEGIRELIGIIPKGALGYVDPLVAPSRAVVMPQESLGTGEARTLFHELEHVSQNKERGYLSNLFDIATRGSSDRDQELLERANQLRQESPVGSAMRRSVLPAANVFDSPRETKANISQAAQLAAVRGEDFLQTPEGEALFPTPEDRAYFYGSIMPTVPSIYPSQGTFVPEEPRVPQDKSYARRLLERLPKFQEGGEVGFLRFPEESRGTRGPSAEQLGTIAKQTGLVGLGFAPGAGMADYLGQFPSMEGGTEPSAVENWRQGNYGTAALQGLGAMGDMMYAVPVLGATVGSAMKGPRAAQRMLKDLPGGKKAAEPVDQAIPSADIILEKAKEVEGLCSFMNCKLFSQQVSGIPNITDLPKVKKAQVGDIYAWPNGTHYAVDIGKGRVIEVEEWGAPPRTSNIEDLINDIGPLDAIYRPPLGTYAPKKVESSELPSEAKKALEELPERTLKELPATKPASSVKFKEDIPNENWLNEKIEDAVLGGTNQFGVPRRMGPVTGYFDRPPEMPVELLARLPGERAEQANVRPESLKYIRENWEEVSKNPPYIEVDPFGKAWVSEGNHRIMAAKEMGLETLPVEIRYFSGGQRRAGELSPENIKRFNESSKEAD